MKPVYDSITHFSLDSRGKHTLFFIFTMQLINLTFDTEKVISKPYETNRHLRMVLIRANINIEKVLPIDG